jgi:hypothetical protein
MSKPDKNEIAVHKFEKDYLVQQKNTISND